MSIDQQVHPVVLTDQRSGKSVAASIVHVYEREEMPPQTDAPTLRNLALVVFSTVPQCSRVAVAVTERSVLLFIFEAAHLWFDVKGSPVLVRRAG